MSLTFHCQTHSSTKWWSRSESNQRHKDFQSFALPTELRDHLVAGEGFEPTTFGLWARRATRLLHPAMYKDFQKWRRNWDSNPGASFPTYRFSRPDPSATWVFLQMFSTGGPCRTRTYDPPVMSRMLWPTELRVHFLSKWWLGWDSNPRPSGYEPDALAS